MLPRVRQPRFEMLHRVCGKARPERSTHSLRTGERLKRMRPERIRVELEAGLVFGSTSRISDGLLRIGTHSRTAASFTRPSINHPGELYLAPMTSRASRAIML